MKDMNGLLLKIDDEVRVMRHLTNLDSWNNSWVSEMNRTIGRKYIIIDMCYDNIMLSFSAKYLFPPFVLKKVIENYLPEELFLI